MNTWKNFLMKHYTTAFESFAQKQIKVDSHLFSLTNIVALPRGIRLKRKSTHTHKHTNQRYVAQLHVLDFKSIVISPH